MLDCDGPAVTSVPGLSFDDVKALASGESAALESIRAKAIALVKAEEKEKEVPVDKPPTAATLLATENKLKAAKAKVDASVAKVAEAQAALDEATQLLESRKAKVEEFASKVELVRIALLGPPVVVAAPSATVVADDFDGVVDAFLASGQLDAAALKQLLVGVMSSAKGGPPLSSSQPAHDSTNGASTPATSVAPPAPVPPVGKSGAKGNGSGSRAAPYTTPSEQEKSG